LRTNEAPTFGVYFSSLNGPRSDEVLLEVAVVIGGDDDRVVIVRGNDVGEIPVGRVEVKFDGLIVDRLGAACGQHALERGKRVGLVGGICEPVDARGHVRRGQRRALWNLTPVRILNVQIVPLASGAQLVAKTGRNTRSGPSMQSIRRLLQHRQPVVVWHELRGSIAVEGIQKRSSRFRLAPPRREGSERRRLVPRQAQRARAEAATTRGHYHASATRGGSLGGQHTIDEIAFPPRFRSAKSVEKPKTLDHDLTPLLKAKCNPNRLAGYRGVALGVSGRRVCERFCRFLRTAGPGARFSEMGRTSTSSGFARRSCMQAAFLSNFAGHEIWLPTRNTCRLRRWA